MSDYPILATKARWIGSRISGYTVGLTKSERHALLDGCIIQLADKRYVYMMDDRQHIRKTEPRNATLKKLRGNLA